MRTNQLVSIDQSLPGGTFHVQAAREPDRASDRWKHRARPRQIAESGARVIITGRYEETLRESASKHGNIGFLAANVAEPAHAARTIEEVTHRMALGDGREHQRGRRMQAVNLISPIKRKEKFMILVTGATGTVGSEVVKQLVEASQKVRALVRDPGKATKFGKAVEVVRGDLEDPASLRVALKNVEVAFLVSAPSQRMVEQETNFIAAAETAGLPRLVKLSNIMAAPESPGPIGRLHAQIESRLSRSGIPATILRPGWFMSNLLMDAQSVKTGQLYSAMENGRIAFTDPFDVAP